MELALHLLALPAVCTLQHVVLFGVFPGSAQGMGWSFDIPRAVSGTHWWEHIPFCVINCVHRWCFILEWIVSYLPRMALQPPFCVISETSKTGPCVWWPLWMFTKLDILVPKDASYLLWGIFTQTCYQASRGLQVETCRWGVCDEEEGAVLMAFLSVWNDWWRSPLLFNTDPLLLCCSYVCSKANVERVHESGGK